MADVQKALAELKEKLSDVLTPRFGDATLTGFLELKDYKVAKAEKRFREHLVFRQKYKVDEIADSYELPEVVKKFPTYAPLGIAASGSPVLLSHFENLDVLGYLKCLKTDELFKLAIYHAELARKHLEEQTAKKGAYVGGLIGINDLEHFNDLGLAKNLKLIRLGKKTARMLDRNYNYMLKVGYYINAPKYFNTIFNIVKPVISDKTIKRIKIYQRGDESWKEALLNEVDAELLPQHYGGTKVGANGDPKCADLFPIGGKIPNNMYLKKYQKPESAKPEEDIEVSSVSEDEDEGKEVNED